MQDFFVTQKLFRFTLICAVFVVCVVGVAVITRHLRQNEVIPAMREIFPTQAHTLFWEENIEYSPQVHIRQIPIIALCYESGIFYDPSNDTITLPEGVSIISTTHNAAFYIHEIVLDGVYLPRDNRLFMVYSPLVINIEQYGNTLNIRTRHGTIVNDGDGYMQLVNLRDIYHTIVIIDPGHGGLDSGAPNVRGRSYPAESEIVLAISQKLLEIFDEPGILLIPTRTENVAVDNGDRYRLANRVADYFVSIHANACDRSRYSRGTLTLYGAAEGSAELAYSFQTALAHALGSNDRGIGTDLGLRILRNSNVPVALLELLFLSNPEEAARLANPATQTLIAETLADVLRGLEARV